MLLVLSRNGYRERDRDYERETERQRERHRERAVWKEKRCVFNRWQNLSMPSTFCMLPGKLFQFFSSIFDRQIYIHGVNLRSFRSISSQRLISFTNLRWKALTSGFNWKRQTKAISRPWKNPSRTSIKRNICYWPFCCHGELSTDD